MGTRTNHALKHRWTAEKSKTRLEAHTRMAGQNTRNPNPEPEKPEPEPEKPEPEKPEH